MLPAPPAAVGGQSVPRSPADAAFGSQAGVSCQRGVPKQHQFHPAVRFRVALTHEESRRFVLPHGVGQGLAGLALPSYRASSSIALNSVRSAPGPAHSGGVAHRWVTKGQGGAALGPAGDAAQFQAQGPGPGSGAGGCGGSGPDRGRRGGGEGLRADAASHRGGRPGGGGAGSSWGGRAGSTWWRVRSRR